VGDFTDLLQNIPSPGEMLLKQEFVDPATGIVIVSLGGGPEGTAWFSAITVHTNAGPATVQFPLPDATDLATARWQWQDAARAAVREFGEQLKASQRRIVLPGSGDALRSSAPPRPPFQKRLS
jgi:hypothetical protein